MEHYSDADPEAGCGILVVTLILGLPLLCILLLYFH